MLTYFSQASQLMDSFYELNCDKNLLIKWLKSQFNINNNDNHNGIYNDLMAWCSNFADECQCGKDQTSTSTESTMTNECPEPKCTSGKSFPCSPLDSSTPLTAISGLNKNAVPRFEELGILTVSDQYINYMI